MKFFFLGSKPSKKIVEKISSCGWSAQVISESPNHLRSGEILILAPGTPPPLLSQGKEEGAFVIELVSKLEQNPYKKSLIDDYWFEKNLEEELPLLLYRLLHFHSRGAEKLQALDHFAESLLKKFEEDLELAKALQQALLPEHPPLFPGIDFTTRFLPSQGSGGDYFDIFLLEKDREIGILLHHSSSHALTAKLLAELLKLQVSEMRERFPTPEVFIQYLVSIFTLEEQKKVEIFYGTLERKTLTFSFFQHGKSFFEVIRGENRLGPQAQFRPGDRVILGTKGLANLLTSNPSRWEGLIQEERSLLDLQNEILAWEHESLQSKPRLQDLVLILFEIDPKILFLQK